MASTPAPVEPDGPSPAPGAGPQPDRAPAASGGEPAAAAPVLVVDDDPFVRRLIRYVLDRGGVPTLLAATHREGLELLLGHPAVAVVLLDYEMPGGDVAGFVEEARAARPGLTIVGTSGIDRRSEFLARGVDRFLEKPFPLEELLGLLGGRLPDR